MLNLLVLVKITVDPAELKPDSLGGRPRLDEAPLRASTFDEHALEAALLLAERHGGAVKILSLLPSEPPPEVLLGLLAMGADEAFLVVDAACDEPASTATLLAAAVRRIGSCDLVLCGDGSLDHYHRQTGPRLAEELGIPSLTQVVAVELDGGRLVVERALEDRTEVVETTLPALVAVGQEINTPRLPAVSRILKAGRKPVTRWGRTDLEAELSAGRCEPMLSTLDIAAPPETRKRIAVEGDSPDEIARALVRSLLSEGVLER